VPDIIDRISTDLILPRPFVEGALNSAHRRFKKIKTKKQSGGVRIMIQPAAELKPILAWLDINILSKLYINPIATAFQKDTSIVKNAKAHSSSYYSVRVDICEFFRSINSDDLIAVLNRECHLLPSWVADSGFYDLISKACFDRESKLPIGYLTSPRIANAVMYDIDTALVKTIEGDFNKFGRSVLTRYADDFVFSTDRRGACKEFVKTIELTLSSCCSPKLVLNKCKTRYMSRKGGTTLITGLRINNNGEVGIHANYRDHVRLLLKLFSSQRLKQEEMNSLRGHLAFIEHADPGFFTKLAFKYYDEIARIRSHEQ